MIGLIFYLSIIWTVDMYLAICRYCECIKHISRCPEGGYRHPVSIGIIWQFAHFLAPIRGRVGIMGYHSIDKMHLANLYMRYYATPIPVKFGIAFWYGLGIRVLRQIVVVQKLVLQI